MSSFNSRLKALTDERRSWLCVGLDMTPEALGGRDLSSLKDHTFKVIDATRDLAVAYKPNFAFFERWGAVGFAWLEETVSYIGDQTIKIADAKRGDIGNTAEQYSQSVFKHFGFDSVTVNPYMGTDSIMPFIKDKNKGDIVSATITKINNNGIDVEVANFIETTIRRKELSKNKEEQNISRYNEGQKIDAKISSIDLTNRKFALSIRQLEIDEEQSLLEKYGSKSSGSVLGDILGKALDEDKDTKAE